MSIYINKHKWIGHLMTMIPYLIIDAFPFRSDLYRQLCNTQCMLLESKRYAKKNTAFASISSFRFPFETLRTPCWDIGIICNVYDLPSDDIRPVGKGGLIPPISPSFGVMGFINDLRMLFEHV